MIITKKAIARRTVLRGLGASLALPLLDSMMPAMVAAAQTAATPVRRLGVVYVPNGMVMKQWTPAADGTGFDYPCVIMKCALHVRRLFKCQQDTAKFLSH